MQQARTVYATYFDSGYLTRALTLLDSLREHGDHSEMWVLCLDDQAHSYLAQAAKPGVRLLKLSDLELAHPELLAVKDARSRAEYIFTLGPTFLLDLFRQQLQPHDLLVYLDADLYFFDTPTRVRNDMADSSVGIIEHRYADRLNAKLAKYGRFNVGWVGFKNDRAGEQVLSWWAERCLEWCFDRPEPGRYADQGYLDSFPDFDGIHILTDPGFNLAPWNTQRYSIKSDGTGKVSVDGHPLTFFHFHGVKETRRWFITSQLVYTSPANKALRENVYKPYLKQLRRNQELVAAKTPDAKNAAPRRGKGLRGLLFRVKLRAVIVASIVSGNAVRKEL